MLKAEHRWAFGTVDIYGFERETPLVAGIVTERDWRGEVSVRRIEADAHAAALGIELGARANSYLEDGPVEDDWLEPDPGPWRCPTCGDDQYHCPERSSR